MTVNSSIVLEEDISIQTLAGIVRNTGRNVLSEEADHFWVEGNFTTNIQIGHVQNKKSICIFAGRPLPSHFTEVECALLANRLNTERDIIRFYFRFVETANRNVLFIDHYTFYDDILVKGHFLASLHFVEFFALEFPILGSEPSDGPIQ